MEFIKEINRKLKKGHWYKNSKTDEPIMIEADLEDKALVKKLIPDINAPFVGLFIPVSFICNKEDIVPLEVTRESLIRFGFILPRYYSFINQIKTLGKVSVKLGPKSYIIKETDKGIHEIQERYNLILTPRRL